MLSDPERRAMYDRFGHAAAQGGENPFARGFEASGFGGLGDIFDTFFGGANGRAAARPDARRRRPPLDDDRPSRRRCSASSRDSTSRRPSCARSATGCARSPAPSPSAARSATAAAKSAASQQSIFGQFVNVTMCDRCRGEGRVVSTPCKHCRGSGREKRKRTLSVKIPAGVDNGSQMRLTGEGEIGGQGGPRGNLYIAINVKPHEVFRRDEDDILLDLDLNFAQAALGDEVEVPTIDGEQHELRSPPGRRRARSSSCAAKACRTCAAAAAAT